MDESIMAIVESHRISDSAASVSLVQINSIAVDISTNAMGEMDAPIHEHFSIRGFVAGMRKKNPKTCVPYASQAKRNCDLMDDHLPPLLVPRFRWWQCSNCFPDVLKKSTTQETVEADRSDVCTSSCQNVGEKSSLFQHSMENADSSGINDKPAGNPLSGTNGALSVLPYRRKPKLRSLADILVEKKNPISDNPKALMQITTTEMEAVLGPQIELDVPVAKATKSPDRKRTISLEEDRGPLGLIFPKRIRSLASDAEKKCKSIVIFESETKRNKTLNIRKKMKRTEIANGTVSRRYSAKVSVECTANLKKRDVSQETRFGESGEMGAYFRSVLSEQRMHRISNVSDKTPGVEAAADDTLMPNSKGVSNLPLNSYKGAERNSKSEASIVQRRCIPDLNVEFHQKTAKTHRKQFCAVSKKNLLLHKTLDASAYSSSKEKSREHRNKPGLARSLKKDRNLEIEASDDIPMEIVELLARNQHERALGTSRKHINNSPTGYHVYRDGHPIRRSDLTTTSRNMVYGQNNISENPTPLQQSHRDMAKPDESQFRLLTSSIPIQQRKRTQFPTSSSTELLWPPTRENVSPFCLSVPHNQPVQTNNTGVHLFSSQDKQAMLKEAKIVSGCSSVGSLNPYSNDTIPAMQLLSLMDPHVVSGSSFELGTRSFLDKPFSPSTHHAWLNGKENHNFLGRSIFPQNSHSNHFSGFSYGVYSSGESSKKVTTFFRGQGPVEVANLKSNYLKGSSSLMIRPARSELALGVCTLNRNPADFSIPGARNEFTISAKHLKPRNRNDPNKKSRMVYWEGSKRQKIKNDKQNAGKIADDYIEL
ncbi:hypothetical protein OROGR_027104 [Orobanche gracilis]